MIMPDVRIYDPEDLMWLARDVPLAKLSVEGLATDALNHSVAALEAGETGMDGADLDPLAGGLARCLASYGQDVRDDLLLRNQHRSLQTMGGLLAMLMPMAGDRKVLDACMAMPTRRPWAVGLAQQMFGDAELDLPLAKTMKKLRDLIGKVRSPMPELWRIDQVPTVELAALKAQVAEAYASGGADVAQQILEDAKAEDRHDVLARFLRYKNRR